MYCQKCRTPLALHASLDNLNPASFHLLADAPALPQPQQSVDSAHASQHQQQRQQPRQLYAAASARARSPVFRRTDANAAARPDDAGNAPTSSGPPSPTAGRERAGMSFVNITDSQVVPPAVALRANKPRSKGSPPRRRRQRHQRRSGKHDDDSDGSSSSSEDGRLSRRMATSARLFDVLSARSDIDHPVCGECADALVTQLERRLADAARERDAYIDFLRELRASAPGDDEAQAARAELVEARAREKAALAELEQLEAQRYALESETAALEAEAAALEADEAAFWRARNAFGTSIAAHNATKASAAARFAHDARVLEALRRTDVYTDAFAISYDGSFGTINGLRLGRLPRGPDVDWAEVNAAWGMAALLLDTLAEKLRFRFRGWRLHPLGSASKLERLQSARTSKGGQNGGENTAHGEVGNANSRREEHATTAATTHDDSEHQGEMLPLHRSDTPLNLAWMHKGFDAAMVAFLECMRQLGRHVEDRAAMSAATAAAASGTSGGASIASGPTSPGMPGGTAAKARAASPTTTRAAPVKMPYAIERDRINGCSIKSNGFAADESWTKACKHTLTYCKFLMAYTRDVKVTNMTDSDDGVVG